MEGCEEAGYSVRKVIIDCVSELALTAIYRDKPILFPQEILYAAIGIVLAGLH